METLTAHWNTVKNYEIATAFISMGEERESIPTRSELQILQQQGLLAAANFSAVMRRCSSHLKYPVLPKISHISKMKYSCLSFS